MQNDMRDRLVELLSYFADGYKAENRHVVPYTKVYDIADHLIANGVIVPPCKVGDIVYCIVFLPVGCYWYVAKGFVREICTTNEGTNVNIVDCEHTKYANLNITVHQNELGKTVFLTKDQAEQKLKEMRVDNGNL